MSIRAVCQVEQETGNVDQVIRPTWSPETDEQRQLLAVAVEQAQIADIAEEKTWELIVAARKAGVPDLVLCERTNRSRSTLNRKYGPRSAPAE